MKDYQCKTCVLLVNYNSSQDTLECLDSLLVSNSEKPFVVVVDNASTNGFDLSLFFTKYQNLHLIKSDINVGFGKANNLGINWIMEHVKCEYIFILNNDTTIDTECIPLLEKTFESVQDDNLALIAPKILIYDNPDEVWYEGGSLNFRRITPTQSIHNPKGFTHFASGCAMFFSVEKLRFFGGFDPFFFMYDEDVELSLRVTENGMNILYLPDALVYHKCQGSQTKEKNLPSNQLHPKHPSLMFYLKNTIPNRKYIIAKHLRGTERMKATFFHTLYWLSKCVQFVMYGKIKAAMTVFKLLFI